MDAAQRVGFRASAVSEWPADDTDFGADKILINPNRFFDQDFICVRRSESSAGHCLGFDHDFIWAGTIRTGTPREARYAFVSGIEYSL
jgi:hypothetical protein